MKTTQSPFVIMSIMMKGGISKSALSRIINEKLMVNEKKSVLLNFDYSKDAKDFTPFEALNFAELRYEDEDIDPLQLVKGLKEEYDYVVIDTPGEIGGETINTIDEVDLFVIPYGVDVEETDDLFSTLEILMSQYERDTLNVVFVHSNYHEDEDIAIANAEVKPKIDALIQNRENRSLNVVHHYSQLKFSKVIRKMKKEKQSFDAIYQTNTGGYKKINKRVKAFISDLQKAIEAARG